MSMSMQQFSSTFLGDFARRLLANMERHDGDYERDGVLYCGRCGEPRMGRVTTSEGEVITHPRQCACERAQRAQEAREHASRAKAEHILALRKLGLPRGLWGATFDADDSPGSPISKTCRKYVKAWPEMYRRGAGIVFFGGVGTGKTYYAACIANALIEQERRVLFTTVPDLVSRMSAFSDERDEVIAELCAANLVILDDLGAERDTEFAVEQVFALVGARDETGTPTIYTTNLSMDELRQCPNIRRRRIYDRVLGSCPIQLQMAGQSRRTGAYEARRAEVKDILRGVSLDD